MGTSWCKLQLWTALFRDYIAFCWQTQRWTNSIQLLMMLALSKTAPSQVSANPGRASNLIIKINLSLHIWRQKIPNKYIFALRLNFSCSRKMSRHMLNTQTRISKLIVVNIKKIWLGIVTQIIHQYLSQIDFWTCPHN